MTPSAPVRHAVTTTASAAVLALAFGFFPTGPALAATADPTPAPASDTLAPADCGLLCIPILASSPDAGPTGRPRKSKDPVPVAPVPDDSAPETPSATAGYRPPTGPSSGQDWNSPVTRTTAPTKLAAVAPAGGGGPDGPAPGPIAIGTLLVGASAGAFAWWNRNRNRLRSH
ncbi:hypothetical protein [Arthrobacter sp. 8AJ]|uniref:hypothetical protein n=1 Tax=Arthrobacter sp. 8AJ TaxID=2653130 RepID=UPI0012F13A19|nr:hypothetical protein [Arthrobacter sp. 8AJ]VXB69122.1 conserved exported hypothetical protein [Arthrobacter sp. 8AJ]